MRAIVSVSDKTGVADLPENWLSWVSQFSPAAPMKALKEAECRLRVSDILDSRKYWN